MRHFLITLGAICLLVALCVMLTPQSTVQALPEYSTQTGEPCATCHISPSGGGPRGPRGQAWVASSKPGQVPDLVQALELLGVELTVDPSYFVATEGQVSEAQAPATVRSQSLPLYRWLSDYDGN